jgi:hypothetical protein
MEKKSYNLEALSNALQRDNAIIADEYEKVNKRTCISFICNCGEEYDKMCLEIVSRAGAFCKNCTIKNQTKKMQAKKETICNLESLNSAIERDNAILLEEYDIVRSTTRIKFRCNCGEECIKHILQLVNISGAFCKKCTRVEWTKKTKNTNLERYKVECSAQAPHIKEHTKQKMLKTYGVDNVFRAKEVREKIKNTIMEKYNVEHVSQLQEFKDKIKQSCLKKYNVDNPMKNNEIKEKLKQSVLEKYNVEYFTQTPDFKEKCKQTCLERYNVEHASQTPEFREKVVKTFIERYNVDNPNKTPEIREKIRQTCLKRYNVEYPSQNAEIMERTQKNAKKYKEYVMPSGNKIKVQGYEPFALDELVKIYEESDIITQRKDIPRIKYNINEKQKYYFPDIYIKSINTIIEVKSTWTYKCKEDNIQEKANATKLAGYNYEIWIYDDKGNKTVK